ncbi:MAG: hypothetical protein ACLFNW_02580 [Desulfobacterales bacterium]
MTLINAKPEIQQFLDEWQEDVNGCRQAFLELSSHLEKYDNIKIDFVPRPAVTYSLRVARPEQKKRQLFALIDIIDEAPRWLSVCFYEDLVTDPEEFGDTVPEGILGEDGYCFDVESNDSEFIEYLCRRIDEAYTKAAG